MSEKRGIAAVIVAAGNSERFGKNKLDGFICGIPCIALTLLAFEKSEETLQTVVVTKKENIEKILLLKKLYGLKKLFAVTEGGDCRQESAAKGAAATDPAIDFIAAHDGVAGEDPQLVYQIGEAVGQRPGLAGARPRDHAHEALGGGDRLPLDGIESIVCHIITSWME